MIWLYDNAICEDLRDSFKTDVTDSPVVCVVPPEDVLSIAAQIQNDKIHFPVVAVERDHNTPVDTDLTNFTRMHTGVATVFDKEKNLYYQEKAVPVKLSYTLVVMSTNTADIDEILKELVFKYISQYFLNIKVPYESKRNIRFGIKLDTSQEIQWQTTTSNYLQEGKLHSASVHLLIDGAVLLSYTPVKLRRISGEVALKSGTEEIKLQN